jgi:hypothetical protein
MGDVFIKDPSLGVSCVAGAVIGQNVSIGPANFSYAIVNDSGSHLQLISERAGDFQ